MIRIKRTLFETLPREIKTNARCMEVVRGHQCGRRARVQTLFVAGTRAAVVLLCDQHFNVARPAE